MYRGWLVRLVWMSFGALILAGCHRSPASVRGKVSFEGKPVAKGAVTLLPADGVGPVSGGMIADGSFYIADVAPGKKVVQVVGIKAIQFGHSSEDAMRAAEAAAKSGDASPNQERADEIPPDAVGNNTVVEVKPGKQTIDFTLTRPAGR